MTNICVLVTKQDEQVEGHSAHLYSRENQLCSCPLNIPQRMKRVEQCLFECGHSANWHNPFYHCSYWFRNIHHTLFTRPTFRKAYPSVWGLFFLHTTDRLSSACVWEKVSTPKHFTLRWYIKNWPPVWQYCWPSWPNPIIMAPHRQNACKSLYAKLRCQDYSGASLRVA